MSQWHYFGAKLAITVSKEHDSPLHARGTYWGIVLSVCWLYLAWRKRDNHAWLWFNKLEGHVLASRQVLARPVLAYIVGNVFCWLPMSNLALIHGWLFFVHVGPPCMSLATVLYRALQWLWWRILLLCYISARRQCIRELMNTCSGVVQGISE